jgi:GAF domain-containing protein/HAMP domain-containing protein
MLPIGHWWRTYALFLRIASGLLLLVVLSSLTIGWYHECSLKKEHLSVLSSTLEKQRVYFQLLSSGAGTSTQTQVSTEELSYLRQLGGEALEKLFAGWPPVMDRTQNLEDLQKAWASLNLGLSKLMTNPSDTKVREDFKRQQLVLLSVHQTLTAELNQAWEAHQQKTIWGMCTLGVVSVIAFLHFCRTLFNRLWRPLKNIRRVAGLVANGNLTESIDYPVSDELGAVSIAIDSIANHQLVLADFVEKIGEGDTQARYTPLSENDRLGISLNRMQEKLKQVSKEEKRQQWSNEGHTRFAEVLRNDGTSMSELAQRLLPDLVRYLKVNQGAFFILQENETEIYLERVATFAWERSKMVKQRLLLGEGLAGQAARDGDTLYITDVPNQYAAITSGLGKANPRSILVVPLKSNDVIQGVLELASFQNFEPFEISFVEKLSESIAATLTSVRSSEQTHRLLEESRQLNDHLRTQEEVLRRNAEEMQLVQEEMRRKEMELARQGEILKENSLELQASKENLSLKLEEALTGMKQQIRQVEAEKQKNLAILEGCVDGVISFDQEGYIEFINKAAEDIWATARVDVLGKPIQSLIPLRLEGEKGSFSAYGRYHGQEREVGVRTEMEVVSCRGEEMEILVTLTQAQVESFHTFTIFVQRVSVELF